MTSMTSRLPMLSLSRRRPGFAILALGLGFGSLALTGCSAIKANDAVSKAAVDIKPLAELARMPAGPAAADPLRERRDSYGGNTFTPSDRGEPLPDRLERSPGFRFISEASMTLPEIAAAFTREARYPVRVRDITPVTATGGAVAPASGAPPGGTEVAALLAAANAQIAQSSSPNDRGGAGGGGAAVSAMARSGQATMEIDYPGGSFSSAIALVAARFGYEWENRAGAVELFRYTTKTFQVAALATTANVTVSAGGTGGSGGQGGDKAGATSSGQEQTSTVQAQLRYWDELKATLDKMVGRDGVVVTAPTSGSVTVTATPPTMRTIARFIASENKRLTRRITIAVQVLSVRIADSDQYGLDLDVLFKSAGLALRYAGPTSGLSAGTGMASAGVLEGSGNNFAGTQAAVQALTSTGRVYIDTADAVTTLNNKPASKRIIRRQTFVGEAGVAQTPNAGSQSTIRTVTRETGFFVNFLPRIQEEGEVLLQYAITLSDPSTFTPFESGGVRVQLEDGNAAEIANETALTAGATLVVAGHTQWRASANAQGVGSPWNFVGGGGVSGGIERRQILYLITPVEMARDAAPRPVPTPTWPEDVP